MRDPVAGNKTRERLFGHARERRPAVLGWVLTGILLSAPAHAQQPDAGTATPPTTVATGTLSAEQSAQEFFGQGIRAFGDGQYATAIASFNESIRLFETPAAALNLAVCYERVGRAVEARKALLRYVDLARGRMPPGREEQVRDMNDRLDQLLVHVTLRVVGHALEVTMDGQLLALPTARNTALSTAQDPAISTAQNVPQDAVLELEMDAGVHVFVATGSLMSPARVTRNFRAGEHPEIMLAPEPLDVVTQLHVHSNVPKAEITLDNLVVGTQEFDQRVTPGSHALAIRAEGFLPYLSSVELRPGVHAAIEARLQRKIPLTESPILWTAVGVAAVLTGVVIGIVAGSSRVDCMPGNLMLMPGPQVMGGCLTTGTP